MRTKALSILVVLSMLMLLVAACGATPEPETIVQTVEVEVPVEKEVTVVETVEVEVEKEVTVVETVEVEVTAVPEAPPVGEAPETIKIGTVTDQTGPLAAFGVQCKYGYDKAAEIINADGGIYV